MDLIGTAAKTSSAGTKEWLVASKDMVISAYDTAPMILGAAEFFMRDDLLNTVQDVKNNESDK